MLVASVAVALKVNVPPAVGVPESTPNELRESPVGREPLVTVNVYGLVPPDAVRVCE